MDIFYNLYVLFIGLLFLIGVVFFLVERPNFTSLGKSQFNKKTKLLLYLTFFCVLFGILSPLIVIKSVLHIDKFPEPKSIQDISGPIGDTIGGLVNPFIALAAVIVTGLAFYMQYEANKQAREHFYEGLLEQKKQFIESLKHQRKQFDLENYTEEKRHQELRDTQERVEKIQSFERQFYELLKLHKENVSELAIELDKKSGSSGTLISGRRVFILFKYELYLTYKVLREIFKYCYPKYKGKFNLKIFKLAYYIFFEGILSFNKVDTQKLSKNFQLETSYIDLVKKSLYEVLINYDSTKESQSFYDFKFDPPKLIIVQTFQYTPFISQSSRLGHCFRHLFFILKFVSDKDETLISYSLKRYYLRVLRNQLSNDEQIMLFYNWFSGFGKSWEQSDKELRKKKEGNYFFTNYRMIHNLDESKLIEGIKLDKIFNELEFKNFRYEPNRRKEDILFEIHGYQSSLSEEENQIFS